MKKRILIIDDEIVSLKTTENILNQKYDVITASNGLQGLEILKSQKIDMLLLDLLMPGMDGTEVLRRIREDAELSALPVIVITSSDYQGDLLEVKRLGISDLIHKPIFPAKLLTCVKNYMPRKEKCQILVVDDEPINQILTKKILSDTYDVDCVSSGMDALNRVQTKIPDLILLDLHMPEMDGLEVLAQLKQNPELSEIPIIFLTADDDPKTEIDIFQKGAMDFIRKPFIPEIVRYRIGRILELYRLQNSLQEEVDKKTEQIRESNARVLNLTAQVMLALSGTIDAKDHYTNGHSIRVAEYSRELARRLGKSEQYMNDIFYIGLLHDIGKVGVPDDIINKTDKLTDKEYGVIKTHPIIGAQILEKITEMPDLASGAHWHHERFDGRGYPDGLVGEQIPEIARIIGVADAYDAMTSKRSYRGILPQDVVRNEIIKGRGYQFDPVIADIMLQIMDEDNEYALHE